MRGPAARLLEALDAADTKGMTRADVMRATGLSSDDVSGLVARAITAEKAYRPPGARHIYSTAPFTA